MKIRRKTKLPKFRQTIRIRYDKKLMGGRSKNYMSFLQKKIIKTNRKFGHKLTNKNLQSY